MQRMYVHNLTVELNDQNGNIVRQGVSFLAVECPVHIYIMIDPVDLSTRDGLFTLRHAILDRVKTYGLKMVRMGTCGETQTTDASVGWSEGIEGGHLDHLTIMGAQ